MGRRHGRGWRPPPAHTPPRPRYGAFDPGRPEPDLMVEVRRAVRQPHPLPLLAHASSVLAAVDERRRDPLGRAQPVAVSRAELLASFLDVDRPETSALLAVFAALTDDEVERRRIRRCLAGRDARLPDWVTGLPGAEVGRAVELRDLDGDGEDVMLGLRVPPSHELSVVVLVDHRLGALAKDAFVVPEPLEELVAVMRTEVDDDAGMAWRDLDLADARARITEAVALAAATLPQFESDTWPACRPLVEWAARMLPDGGTGYHPPGSR